MTKVKETKKLVIPNQEEIIILDGLIEYINRVCSKNPKRKALLIAICLLLGGAFACKKANASVEKEPTKIEQLATGEEPKEIEGSALPTKTPETTPEATPTPIPFLVIDEEESDKMAENFLNEINHMYLSEFDILDFPYQKSKNNITIIKATFGDFSDFKNFYNSEVSEETWNSKKEEIFSGIRIFLLDISRLSNSRNQKSIDDLNFKAGSFNLSSKYDDSFSGKETLFLLEKKIEELNNNLNDEEKLTKTAQELQDLIYNIYFGKNILNNGFTPYKDMHPLIQTVFLYYITGVAFIDIIISSHLMSSKPISGSENYSSKELYSLFIEEYDKEYDRLMAVISQYIDDYLNQQTLTYSPTPKS